MKICLNSKVLNEALPFIQFKINDRTLVFLKRSILECNPKVLPSGSIQGEINPNSSIENLDLCTVPPAFSYPAFLYCKIITFKIDNGAYGSNAFRLDAFHRDQCFTGIG